MYRYVLEFQLHWTLVHYKTVIYVMCPCFVSPLIPSDISLYTQTINYKEWGVGYLHSEKGLARSMLFYSRNCQQQNWALFILKINSDCMYIGNFWLQLWPNNHCKNTGYYSIFQLSLLLLLNNYQYNCNNTISSVSV